MERGNYEMLVEFIAENSGLGLEEIGKRIQSKILKLSGLISKEGAAQIVAAELGINFEKQKIKLCQIVPGMKKINVIGKVISLFPVREFNKNGRQGRVVNFVLADDTNNIRTVLWDENHIELIVKKNICEGDCVEISNGGLRNGELHLSSFSEIKKTNHNFENLVTEKPVMKKKISDFNVNENVSTRAVIVQMFEPRFFNVCPECKKKIEKEGDVFICSTHKKVLPEKRAIVNLVIDDGTGSIRAVLFNEGYTTLGFTELENPEKMTVQKQDLLGREMLFSGNVRLNAFFNNLELIVENAKNIDLDETIRILENQK